VASIPLVYYLSWRLAASRSIAFLATLALCYHPRLAGLAFVGAFIYDVLCGFFYFAALAYYLSIRDRGASLSWPQLLGFLLLYVMALNCKEMAVTLPVIVLIYEVLKFHSWPNSRAFLRWAQTYAAPALIAGLLTIFYVYGKLHGTGSLASLNPYRPNYSWDQFTVSNAKFVSQLLFAGHPITSATLLLLWALIFIYAFISRDRILQLMAFWVVIVPLPMAFIVPMRGDAALYLLLFGWAMIFARIVFDLISLIWKGATFLGRRRPVPKGTGALADYIRKLSRARFRALATVLVALALAAFTQHENQHLRIPLFNVGVKTSHVINTFRSLDLRPSHRSSIVLLLQENLFQNKWNVFFIASLLWNDHSLRIWVENENELTPQQQENVDYIISVSEFDADVVRARSVPPSQ
jgi:hypothetical protein